MAKEIEVTFIQGTGTTGVNGERCYYPTDTAITSNSSGLYANATDFAKGTEGEKPWIIHPAFWWDNNNNGIIEEEEQLSGIWVGKFEASSDSKNTDANYGAGTKVQVVNLRKSWRGGSLARFFKVCRDIQATGGVLGTESGLTTIDSHLAKNIEWGAVAILSQSKYGVYNPKSATGENGDKTFQVWNNSYYYYTTGFMTGAQGTSKDASIEPKDTTMFPYAVKASTTGTVYGIYDMAAGSNEYVMGLMGSKVDENAPQVGYNESNNSGFNGNLWDGTTYTSGTELPDKKYYDLYQYKDQWAWADANDNRGKIGDATSELKRLETVGWNNDNIRFVSKSEPVFMRGRSL